MNSLEPVDVPAIAPPGGSYSHAVIGAGRTVEIAGQVGVDREGEVVADEAGAQARQAFRNLGEVLAASGADFDSLLKLTVYLTDRAQAGPYAAARAEFVTAPFPASTVVVVSELLDPRWLLEIDAVASVPG